MRSRPLLLLMLVLGLCALALTAPGRTQPPGDKGKKDKKDKGTPAEQAEREFRKRDADENGFLEGDEIPGKVRDELARWDTNKDGKIDPAELKEHYIERERAKAAKDAGKWGQMKDPKGEAFANWSEWEFQKHDRNGDGRIDRSEAKGPLRDDFDRWDADKNGTIDLAEFRSHLSDRVQEKLEKQAKVLRDVSPPKVTIVEGIDETPPKVVHAGTLPAGLPAWFTELDKNADAQVSLLEWLKGGKTTAEFRAMDRNDDGLLTPDEVLRYLHLSRTAPTELAAELKRRGIKFPPASPATAKAPGPAKGRG